MHIACVMKTPALAPLSLPSPRKRWREQCSNPFFARTLEPRLPVVSGLAAPNILDPHYLQEAVPVWVVLPSIGIHGSCQRNAKLFLQLCWSESKKHTSGSLLQCEVLKMRRIPR